MSIAGAIEKGEQALKDLQAKKETDRVAKLSPEEKTAEQNRIVAEKKAAEDKALLEKNEADLNETDKKRKAEIAEAEKKSAEAEEARILEAKDEELSEDDRAKKPTIVQKRKDAKEADFQASVDKRINEVVGELKAERAERSKDKEKISALETELSRLKSGNDKPQIEAKADALEVERIKKFTEADASLAREKRREMSDEELNDWMIDDMVGAQRWLAQQVRRREREKDADIEKLGKSNDIPDDTKKKVEAIIAKQAVSKGRAEVKYPEITKRLNVNARVNELSAQGKSRAEIQAILFKEVPETKIAAEILAEGDEKYQISEDSPELLVEEIARRLGKSTVKKEESPKETQDERDARIAAEAIEAENKRRAGLPPDGLKSNQPPTSEKQLSAEEKKAYDLFKKNFPKKTFADFLANRERNGGRG